MKRNERERKATVQAGRQARKASSIANLGCLAGTILGTLIGGFALDQLNLLYANIQGSSIMLLRPHLFTWFGLAAPIALPLSILLYNPILERVKGSPPSRFSIDYFLYSDTVSPVIRNGVIAIAGIFIAIALSFIPYHLRLTDSALFLGEFGNLAEQEWSFRDLSEVSLAHYFMSGTRYSAPGTSPQRVIYVKHRSGKVWTLAGSILNSRQQNDYELARLIARHSGLDINFPERVVGQPTLEEFRNRELRGCIGSLTLFILVCGGPYAFARWKNRRQLHGSK